MRSTLSAAVSLLGLVAQLARAQATTSSEPATLTLDEAFSIARRNNPAFLQTANERRSAGAAVRSAYGALLPSVDADFASRYQQGGQQVFNGLAFNSSSDAVQSSYGLSVNYRLNSATIFNPKLAGANRAAAEADITGATEVLRATVSQQYLAVLQAQARAALQDTLTLTADGQLELAKAKQAVGAGTVLDVRRAEVALGQAQVAAITAHNTADVEMLRLFQQLGVAQPDNVVLTTHFDVTPITFSKDSVVQLAQQRNPILQAYRSREHAATMGVRSVAGQYAPTLSLSTGWGGNSYQYTNDQFVLSGLTRGYLSQAGSCFSQDSLRLAVGMPSLNCGSLFPGLTAADSNAALARNNQFPFKFTRSPLAFTAILSIPVFDNFNREQRLEEAQVSRDNARFSVRATELKLKADVTQAYLDLTTAVRTVELQEVNAQKAREELSYAEERYRVGAATFLDVTTSRGTFEQAQIDRLNAIYNYHKAYAALESAVGRPLR
jgi:outer membrane protein